MERFAHAIFRNGNIYEIAVSICCGRRQQGIELIVCMLVWCHFNSSSYRSASRIASSVAMNFDFCNFIPFKLALQCWINHDACHLALHLQIDAIIIAAPALRAVISHIVGGSNFVSSRLVGW